MTRRYPPLNWVTVLLALGLWALLLIVCGVMFQ